ncbi:MAG: VanW family protein [Thermomicrobiales bacterium]
MRSFSVALLFGLAALSGLGLYALTHQNRTYEGVSIAGVDLGGMTESVARGAVDAAYRTYLGQPLPVEFEGKTFSFVPRDAGIQLDSEKTVGAAMSLGRQGSWWARTRLWAGAIIHGSDAPAVLTVDQRRLVAALSAFAPMVTKAPQNAFVQMGTHEGPAIVPEVPGVALDVGATETLIFDRLSTKSGAAVSLVAPSIAPAITASSLRPSLSSAQAAVSSALVMSAVGKEWTVSQDDLKKIVIVSDPGQAAKIDEPAVRQVVQGIAREIDQPAVDAALFVNEQNQLTVAAASRSVKLDQDVAAKQVVDALLGGAHSVNLPISQVQPTISDRQAAAAMTQAEALVGHELKLTWSGGTIPLSPVDLLAALTIVTTPGKDQPIALDVSPEVIVGLLQTASAGINVDAKNVRLRYVNGVVQSQAKAASGRSLDVEKSTATIIKAVRDHAPSAALTIVPVKPKFTEANVGKISLPDVLGESSTYYGTSSDARRRNVERAVTLEDGWMVAPGDVFSYDENVGKVTAKNGFVTGLGILSDGAGGITTAPVIGGGICQVSTTVFQAAFWAGMQVVERYSHPYWIKSYGEPPHGMLGLDAMINIEDQGSLDMKMRNTTDHWMAVVVKADGQNVTTQVLGVKPGWTITIDDSIVSNVVVPVEDTIYQDSPELATGETKQVESAQQGFDTAIHRTITDKSGKTIDDFTLSSTYVPARNRILRGTGPAT